MQHLILAVDDRASIREFVSAVLLAGGFGVLLANDGEHGLTLFSRHADSVSLVISDISMPLMPGPAMVEKIRGIKPEVPVIFMTGTPTTDGLPLDCATLAKPFTADELLDRVRDCLSASRTADQDV